MCVCVCVCVLLFFFRPLLKYSGISLLNPKLSNFSIESRKARSTINKSPFCNQVNIYSVLDFVIDFIIEASLFLPSER